MLSPAHGGYRGADAETFVQPQLPGEFEVGAVKHSSLFLQQQVASSGTFFLPLVFCCGR